jgi:hypothetical protein
MILLHCGLELFQTPKGTALRMRVRLWLMLSLCVGGITWLYAARVLGPWEHYQETRDGIKMQMGDLYPRWVGTRELLLHHRNPYGPEVSHEIQKAFYGHPVNPYPEPGTSLLDEQRFVYPVYTVFLLAPTVYSDFVAVRRLARLFLGLLTAASVLLCLDILHQRPPWEIVTALVLFTLSSPQVVQGLRLEQLALVVAFLLIAGVWCLGKNYLATAGALLALSTIKPQMALLPLCAFFVWVLGNWPKRWPLAASFLTTLAVLVTAGEVLLPGWVGYFVAGIAAYRRYDPSSSLLQLILGSTFGEILGGAVVLGLLLWTWQNRTEAADSRKFINIFAGFLIGTILAFPLFIPFNQVLLTLPVLLVLQDWTNVPRFSRILFAIAVSWPWIASVVLLFFPPQLNSQSQLLQRLSLLVSFFPLFLLLVLMTRNGRSFSRLKAHGFASVMSVN